MIVTSRRDKRRTRHCRYHGAAKTAPEWPNDVFFYLSPNTTSEIQLFNAGFIQSMKARYRRYQIKSALDLAGEDNISQKFTRLRLLVNCFHLREAADRCKRALSRTVGDTLGLSIGTALLYTAEET